jgi:hypothetical protein
MIEINEFRRNQSQFPLSELAKYNGQYVAWSDDGKAIVAAHGDPSQLEELLRNTGRDPSYLLVTFVSVPEEVAWSGWSLGEDASQL